LGRYRFGTEQGEGKQRAPRGVYKALLRAVY